MQNNILSLKEKSRYTNMNTSVTKLLKLVSRLKSESTSSCHTRSTVASPLDRVTLVTTK